MASIITDTLQAKKITDDTCKAIAAVTEEPVDISAAQKASVALKIRKFIKMINAAQKAGKIPTTSAGMMSFAADLFSTDRDTVPLAEAIRSGSLMETVNMAKDVLVDEDDVSWISKETN